MTATMNLVLIGFLAAAALVAAIFFLRFWWQTRDSFFLLFSLAFGIDGVGRFFSPLFHVTNDSEPLLYIPRLFTFGIIAIAILRKNLPSNR